MRERGGGSGRHRPWARQFVDSRGGRLFDRSDRVLFCTSTQARRESLPSGEWGAYRRRCGFSLMGDRRAK